jgi:hypothetical protein
MGGEIVTYIGDGVYASFDGFYIWIWTDNSQRIALEPKVLSSLSRFAQGCFKAACERLAEMEDGV